MRNLLALAAAALLTFGVVGYFRGWYQVKTSPAAGGHQQIQIDVNRPKISEDVNASKAKLREILSSNENNGSQSSTKEKSTFGVPTSHHVAEDGTFVYPGSEQSEPKQPR